MTKLRKFLILSLLFCWGVFIAKENTHLAQQAYSVPTSPSVPYYVGYARVDQQLFNVSPVTTLTASTTLTQAQSATAVVVGTSGGITVTLPAPAVLGMTYDVIFGTSQTSGTVKVITDAATTFVTGTVAVMQSNTSGNAVTYQYQCNGSSHISIATNGTTTGGLIGGWLRFKTISPTLWEVIGTLVGTGTTATPCSTS